MTIQTRQTGNFIAIHHVSVVVADVRKSLDFYCGVLGLQQDHERPELSFEGAWLAVDTTNTQQIHLLQVENPDSTTRPEHGGRDRHTAFRVKNIDVIEASLSQHKIPYTKSQSGRIALFCRDPDGNTLEIMQ